MSLEVRAVAALVERMLRADGPLPALGEEQRTLAGIVARALDAPPGAGALVTLTQAATGTGKTVALLAPVMALAALQRRQGVRAQRAALSTFTNHLARQILDDDAPRIARALEALGLPAVTVAARAGRGQFIDPDRVERAIERLGCRHRDPEGRALEALAAFETFAEAEDHGVYVPAGFTADALCVTPRSSASAAAAFSGARRAAAAADVVLTNHALVLTDCRYRGRVLGIGSAVDTVLFDEADALPEAARSVADERIGLGRIADVVEGNGTAGAAACRALARLCARETARGTPRLLAHCEGSDAIVDHVRRIREVLESAAPTDEDAAEESALLAARLRAFVECAHADTRAVAAIAPGEPPALAVVHRAPVRWLRRVFDTATTAFLVSATLAAPAARPSPNALMRALGIGPGAKAPGRVNAPGWADLQPRRYGAMDFRFADRAAPAPFRPRRRCAGVRPRAPRLRGAGDRGREAKRAGAGAVHELPARRRARPAGARRHRARARRAPCEPARCVPRRSERVLLTPAAWTGLSLPGLVEHVVIPRIPFRPPSVEDEARRRFLAELGLAPTGIERLLARDRAAAARRTLAQGIGRGIRGPRERCTVWLLDPRFPLPKSMTRAIGGPDQGLAAEHLALMYAIPARFRTGPRPAVDRGRIWPLARDASRTPPAGAVTETETDRSG